MRIIIFNQSTMCFNHIQKSSIVLRIHKNEKLKIFYHICSFKTFQKQSKKAQIK